MLTARQMRSLRTLQRKCDEPLAAYDGVQVSPAQFRAMQAGLDALKAKGPVPPEVLEHAKKIGLKV